MKPHQLTITTVFLLFSSLLAVAQQGTIEGYIKDIDSKTPITGASINILSGKGDNTDAFGAFRFSNLSAGQYELIASHVGY